MGKAKTSKKKRSTPQVARWRALVEGSRDAPPGLTFSDLLERGSCTWDDMLSMRGLQTVRVEPEELSENHVAPGGFMVFVSDDQIADAQRHMRHLGSHPAFELWPDREGRWNAIAMHRSDCHKLLGECVAELAGAPLDDPQEAALFVSERTLHWASRDGTRPTMAQVRELQRLLRSIQLATHRADWQAIADAQRLLAGIAGHAAACAEAMRRIEGAFPDVFLLPRGKRVVVSYAGGETGSCNAVRFNLARLLESELFQGLTNDQILDAVGVPRKNLSSRYVLARLMCEAGFVKRPERMPREAWYQSVARSLENTTPSAQARHKRAAAKRKRPMSA